MKKKQKSNRQVAALARRCGITEREATDAVDNLIHGDGELYRREISSRLHGIKSNA